MFDEREYQSLFPAPLERTSNQDLHGFLPYTTQSLQELLNSLARIKQFSKRHSYEYFEQIKRIQKFLNETRRYDEEIDTRIVPARVKAELKILQIYGEGKLDIVTGRQQYQQQSLTLARNTNLAPIRVLQVFGLNPLRPLSFVRERVNACKINIG